MKTLIFNLAAVLVLFVLGCQENSVTDPIANESVNKTQFAGTHTRGIIPIHRLLNDPYPIGNSYYSISGQIEYEQNSVPTDPIQDLTKQIVSLHLTMNADLKYVCTLIPPSPEDELAGFISEESAENLAIAGNFPMIFEKSFLIEGREDGMILKCRFSFTTGEMKISAMWLALPDKSVKATNTIN